MCHACSAMGSFGVFVRVDATSWAPGHRLRLGSKAAPSPFNTRSSDAFSEDPPRSMRSTAAFCLRYATLIGKPASKTMKRDSRGTHTLQKLDSWFVRGSRDDVPTPSHIASVGVRIVSKCSSRMQPRGLHKCRPIAQHDRLKQQQCT